MREPHFAHFEGAGSDDCETYRPGASGVQQNDGGTEPPAIAIDITRRAGGEEDWAIFLQLAELTKAEVSGLSPDTLFDFSVRIASAGEQVRVVTAMELRPCRGGAFIVLPPSTDSYVVATLGDWPSEIDTARYNVAAPGMDTQGTFFRQKGGNWVRARRRETFQRGESIVVVGDSRGSSKPPTPATQLGVPTASKGRLWSAWRLTIPVAPSTELAEWLVQHGHAIGERQPASRLRSLPLRVFGDRYQYGHDDLILVDATGPEGTLTVTLVGQSDARPTTRRTIELDRTTWTALVAVQASGAPSGTYEVDVGGRSRTTFDVIDALDDNALRARLTALPRLRMWIDGAMVPPASGARLSLPRNSKAPVVKIDAMLPEARVSLVTQTGSRRRAWPSITAREAELILAEMLAVRGPTSFELDAAALGRVRAKVSWLTTAETNGLGLSSAPGILHAGKAQRAARLRELARRMPGAARMLRACANGAAPIPANLFRESGKLISR